MCACVCGTQSLRIILTGRGGFGPLFDKIVITVISKKKKIFKKKVSGHGINVHPWAHKRILGQVGLLVSLLS